MQRQKHIIFSSDKPINQIKGVEERLMSRFQWGYNNRHRCRTGK
ncbi:MAG: hypothetical protein IPM38_09605 [Ignavibacteria bacterium]|nr:hypothetical protein [Ignavibacteria bacterium]